MARLKTLRKAGWILFGLMWIPFTLIFVGMIGVPEGSFDWAELPALTRISMVLVGLLAAGSTLLLVGSALLGAAINSRLQQTGVPAYATILEVHDTGTTVNENPLVRLVVEVRPENAPAFRAETERLVSRLQIPQIQPGQEILVRYDPESREVALDD